MDDFGLGPFEAGQDLGVLVCLIVNQAEPPRATRFICLKDLIIEEFLNQVLSVYPESQLAAEGFISVEVKHPAMMIRGRVFDFLVDSKSPLFTTDFFQVVKAIDDESGPRPSVS